MALSKKYRQFANECLSWAAQSTDASQRQIFHDLARQWTAIAEEIERAGPHVTNEASLHANLKRLMD